MKDLYKMTKEELVLRCRRLQSENEGLRDELDDLGECYSYLENKLADINDEMYAIYDVDWFKFRLMEHDLLTEELEDFIDYYLKYHNVVRGWRTCFSGGLFVPKTNKQRKRLRIEPTSKHLKKFNHSMNMQVFWHMMRF